MTTPRALSDDELKQRLKEFLQYPEGHDIANHITFLNKRIEELEKEFNAAQKRFETTSELSCERAIEIEELKEQLATLKSENEKLKAKNGELKHAVVIERNKLQAELSTLRQLCDDQHKAIWANHKWHEAYDEYGGYPESDLCEQNCKALTKYNSTKGERGES